MKKTAILLSLTMAAVLTPAFADDGNNSNGFQVIPGVFDPFNTHLVAAVWISGIGCPTGAKVVLFNSMPPYNLLPPSTFTDPACPTGDTRDKLNEGLLLAKTGPTLNDASGVAQITGVQGITLTEFGYDIRKADPPAGPRGSHCGAGAPRFNIVTSDGVLHFTGCDSPPPTVTSTSNAWQRLRWTPTQSFPPITPGSKIKSIEIVFDEGTDPSGGPDLFSLAVIDNIDINGVLIGQGPLMNQNGNGNGGGNGEDKNDK
jgi:hypothetical protein